MNLTLGSPNTLHLQCRARGVNPGGSREALMERVRDHMVETGNL